jgi:cytochrome c biogenesis factor
MISRRSNGLEVNNKNNKKPTLISPNIIKIWWTLMAWAFLTFGITLGSWWAYYELGWGGWWFWDPVENASFMPWLVATALVPYKP